MEDKVTRNGLKAKYRVRFYRDQDADLPKLQTGPNVLSSIKDYFNNNKSQEESPGRSLCFSAEKSPESIQITQGSSSAHNSPFSGFPYLGAMKLPRRSGPYSSDRIPGAIKVWQGSSTSAHKSPLSGLPSVGHVNESRLEGSPSSSEKMKIGYRFNYKGVVSNKEIDEHHPDMPIPLEEEMEDEDTINILRNTTRDQMYRSVVQKPLGKSSLKRENEEFVMEKKQNDKMSFLLKKRRTSIGSSEETRSAVSNTFENQKLPHKADVFSGQSSFCLNQGSEQTRKDTRSNVEKRITTDERKSIANSQAQEERRLTQSSVTSVSQPLPIKSMVTPEQSPFHNTNQQTKKLRDVTDKLAYYIRKTNTEHTAETSKSSTVTQQLLVPEPAEAERSNVQSQTMVVNADVLEFPVITEDEDFVINVTESDSESWEKKTPEYSNKSQKKRKTVKSKVEKVTNVSVRKRKSRESVPDSRNDATDSTPSLKEKNLEIEVKKLDVDNKDESLGSKPKRISNSPLPWWIVKPGRMNSTFGIDELPFGNNKGDESALMEPSEIHDEQETFDLDKQNVEKSEKPSTTLTKKKRGRKPKATKSEEIPGSSNVKIRKPRTAQVKRQKERQHERREREPDSLSTPAIPGSAHIGNPQCLPLGKHMTDKHSMLSEDLEKCKDTEEKETQPAHRLPQQSQLSPSPGSSKSTFESGPVLRTKAVRYNSKVDAIVKNVALTDAEFQETNTEPTSAVVLDCETESDVFAKCIFHQENVTQGHASGVVTCLDNRVFSTGKIVLRSKQEEIRELPYFDILIFYVLSGKVGVNMHKSFYTFKRGSFFFIPPKNIVHIRNLENEETELIFTQIKTYSDS